MFSSIFGEVFCCPWQIHHRQCRSDGGQEAEYIIRFTQKSREGTGDDVGGWVVQEIEVRIQRLVEKIDGQGGAEQESQYLRHPAGAWMETECKLMSVHHEGTSNQLGQSRASAAPGMQRA